MKASLAFVSTLLLGANAQCKSSVCDHNATETGRPAYQTPCYNSANGCVDCSTGEYFDFADPRFNASAPGCVSAAGANPSCIDRFSGKDMPFPQWLAMLSEPDKLEPFGFVADDIPAFVSVVYGFYANQFSTARFAGDNALNTSVDEDNEVYVTLYEQSANCQADAVCSAIPANFTNGLPHMDGLKFGVSKCTRLIFNSAPVSLVFKTQENGQCGFGLFTGHECKYSDEGGVLALGAAEPTTEAAGGTCVNFPANQGFQLTVSCFNANDQEKSYRATEDAVLDRALHDLTCRDQGRITFPCSTPTLCDGQVTPSSESFVNATIACESEILNMANNCSAARDCLRMQADITGSTFDTSCLASEMCTEETSSSSVLAGSALLAFLVALF